MALAEKRTAWVFFILAAVLTVGVAARFLPRTEEVRVALLAGQQLLFILGGLAGGRREAFALPDGSTFSRSLLSGVMLYGLNTVMGVLSVRLALYFLDYDLVQNLLIRERSGAAALLASNKPLVFLGMVLLLTIGAPIGEELFFRGLLVDLWKERYGTGKAVLASSVVFALLHFYVLQFVPVLLSGIFLGILFVRSENIAVPIIAHSAVNSIALAVWLLRL